MKPLFTALILVLAVLAAVAPVAAQQRPDVIWARKATSLTLDGVLNEAAWARAESVIVRYGRDTGIPGSGWKEEGGVIATDSTYATLKFLVVGNQLYMGAKVRDRSVGGSATFNRFDGFLMSLKDHSVPDQPKPPAEYTYAWWYPTQTDPQPPGQPPAFIGKWATWPPGSPRTQEQRDAWDAVTIVQGLSNSDGTLDQGYTTEMRFNLTPMGYDVTRPTYGDIVEWNISIYDCDWFWPLDPSRFSSNRTWWQSPWANAAWYNEVRIYARPDVTINSGPVPVVGEETDVPNGASQSTPVIDGVLSESVWNLPPTHLCDIRYGDDALRQSYINVGPYRAGQYQPEVNGGYAYVVDPGDATVRWFFKGDYLYMGFDVRDQFVQYHPNFDRWDGFIVTINDRAARGPDHNLAGRRLSFQVGPTGNAMPQDYLATMVQGGTASVAIALKSGTTVDTLGYDTDTGYTAELALNMTALGYPTGLGDGALFVGVDLLDGDSFIPITDSYGTRTWWYRQYENECCPAWGKFNTGFVVTGVNGPEAAGLDQPSLLEALPNPSSAPLIRYQLPQPRNVLMQMFDVGGRMIEERALGVRPAGTNEIPWGNEKRPAGLYYYRLRLTDPARQAPVSFLDGRLVLLR